MLHSLRTRSIADNPPRMDVGKFSLSSYFFGTGIKSGYKHVCNFNTVKTKKLPFLQISIPFLCLGRFLCLPIQKMHNYPFYKKRY